MPRAVRIGENDLQTWCLKNDAKYIINEWDTEKNGDLSPELISYSSNKSVWWICSQNHSFSMIIANRTRKRCQCPYCSNHRLHIGYNDFQTWCMKNEKEDLLKEWNYSRNGDLKPHDIMPGSRENVWWVCSCCSFEWECEIYRRTGTKNQYGCPRCASKKRADLQRIPIVGKNDLATTNPELLVEWDYEKNIDFTPQTIKAGSGYKVWWRCPNGHSYHKSPLLRAKGSGCPECAKEIRSSFPEQSVFFYVKKYFQDAVNTDRKAIGKELDVYIPSRRTAIEYDGVQWHNGDLARKKEEEKDLLCNNAGITMIRIREKGLTSHTGSVCIFRENNNTNRGLSDVIISVLETIEPTGDYDVNVDRDITEIYSQITYSQKEHSIIEELPELAEEWDKTKNKNLTPESVVLGSGKMVWWRCKKGHSWRALVSSRAKGNGCPYCSNHLVLPGFNDIVTCAPELAAEWDYEKNGSILPENVLSGSGHKYWWKCKFGHPSWYISVDARRSNGCPYCSGRLAIPGETDIKTTRPDLAAMWDYEKNVIEIDTVKANSNRKFWWKCSRNHSWKASPNNRNSGSGCPYCSGHKVIPGETDLATNKPDLVQEWDFEKNTNIYPFEVTLGSQKKVWWKCNKGHSWIASISDRTRGRGCPYCFNKVIIKGYNDLATTHPDIAKEWALDKNGTLLPSDVPAGSEKKVWWRCGNGHEWVARISNRVHGRMCPYCSGKRIIVGVNDLAASNPDLMKQWDYEKNEKQPTEVSKGSEKKAWWKCTKDHSWQATIASRSSGNGCPYCSNKRVLVGYNDLATLKPEIAEEWDYEKNDILPQAVMPGSAKTVYWKCRKGHSWKTSVRVRTKGSGCPICSNKKIISGLNDLVTIAPQIAKEWNYEKNDINPSEISVGSKKKYWWKCLRCGHEWQSSVGNRTRGHGCPKCAVEKRINNRRKRRTNNN